MATKGYKKILDTAYIKNENILDITTGGRVVFTGYKANYKEIVSYRINDDNTRDAMRGLYGNTFNIYRDAYGNYHFTNIH